MDAEGLETELRDLSLVSASATNTGGGTYVTLSNRSLDDERTVEVSLDHDVDDADGQVLFAEQDPAEYSTRDNAYEFEAVDLDVGTGGRDLEVALRPNSVAGVEVDAP